MTSKTIMTAAIAAVVTVTLLTAGVATANPEWVTSLEASINALKSDQSALEKEVDDLKQELKDLKKQQKKDTKNLEKEIKKLDRKHNAQKNQITDAKTGIQDMQAHSDNVVWVMDNISDSESWVDFVEFLDADERNKVVVAEYLNYVTEYSHGNAAHNIDGMQNWLTVKSVDAVHTGPIGESVRFGLFQDPYCNSIQYRTVYDSADFCLEITQFLGVVNNESPGQFINGLANSGSTFNSTDVELFYVKGLDDYAIFNALHVPADSGNTPIYMTVLDDKYNPAIVQEKESGPYYLLDAGTYTWQITGYAGASGTITVHEIPMWRP